MLISTSQLPQKSESHRIIHWSGDDSWVVQVLKNLGIEGPYDDGPMTGSIVLFVDAAGFVYGKGSFSFVPKLACYLCQDPKPYPIKKDFEVTWRPSYRDNPPKEMALSADQLDEYFIENGQIDLGQVLLDSVNDAIPDVTKFFAEGDANCKVCGKDVSNTRHWQVFGH